MEIKYKILEKILTQDIGTLSELVSKSTHVNVLPILINDRYGTEFDLQDIKNYFKNRPNSDGFPRTLGEYLKHLKDRKNLDKNHNGKHKGDKTNKNRSLGKGFKLAKRINRRINTKTPPGYHHLSAY